MSEWRFEFSHIAYYTIYDSGSVCSEEFQMTNKHKETLLMNTN